MSMDATDSHVPVTAYYISHDWQLQSHYFYCWGEKNPRVENSNWDAVRIFLELNCNLNREASKDFHPHSAEELEKLKL